MPRPRKTVRTSDRQNGSVSPASCRGDTRGQQTRGALPRAKSMPPNRPETERRESPGRQRRAPGPRARTGGEIGLRDRHNSDERQESGRESSKRSQALAATSSSNPPGAPPARGGRRGQGRGPRIAGFGRRRCLPSNRRRRNFGPRFPVAEHRIVAFRLYCASRHAMPRRANGIALFPHSRAFLELIVQAGPAAPREFAPILRRRRHFRGLDRIFANGSREC